MLRSISWLILLAVSATSMPVIGWAQTTDSPSETEESATGPRKEQSTTDPKPAPPNLNAVADAANGPLFFFFSKDGQLVLGSNIKYEDIQAFYDLKQGLRQQESAPKFVIEKVDVRSTVRNEIAELTVQFEIEIVDATDGSVPVPLELGGIIRPEFQYRGEGKQFVVFDGESYVCWIDAKAESRHVLTVKAVVPIERFKDASSLSLTLPYAPCRMQMDVPIPRAAISLSDRRSVVTTRRNGTKGTQAIIDSRGGELAIRWSKADGESRDAAPLVFAQTSLIVRIENPQLIRVEADVEARAARGELTEFDVLLPAGLKLSPRRSSGYEVTEPIAAPDGRGSLVRINLDTPAQRAPRIRLAGEITLKPDEAKQPLEVWGFEVVGAHQTGNIALIAGDDWVVTPMEGDSIRRDRSPPEDARIPNTAARFTVVSQPCSLKIAIGRKATRVVIDPTYYLDVAPTKTAIEMRLLCRFGNGRPLDLELPLQGWDVSELLPQRLAGPDGGLEIQDGNLTIPLAKISDAPMGDAEIIIRAERPHPAGNALHLPLPTPRASRFSPGLSLVVRAPLVVASAANNVQLTPDVNKMSNLRPENIDENALPDDLRSRQQPPFAFRGDTATSPLAFHGVQQVRPRSIVTTPALTLTVEDGKAIIDQRIRFDVSYEPITTLRFIAPASTARSPDFQVVFEQQTLTPETIDDSGFQVALPESQLGEFSLLIRHSTPLPEMESEAAQAISIPLAIPEEANLKSTPPTLRCKYPDDLRLEVATGMVWTESISATRSSDGSLDRLFSAADSVDKISFQLRSAEAGNGSIAVDRGWVQTWLTPKGRRERVAFRISTTLRRLSVRLPEGAEAAADELVIAADGLRIEKRTIDGRNVLFDIPDSSVKEHVIELWYSFGGGRPSMGEFNFEMPIVNDARRVNEFYWELITPKNEHLFLLSETMTPEMRWKRNGLTYAREPLLSTRQMAELTGASTNDVAPPRDANRYVFSSLGNVRTVQVTVIRRGWLVAIVGGAVMLIGVAWLSLHDRRRSLFFLGVAVLIACLTLVFPDPAVLAAQAGFIGLAFLGLGWILKWAFRRERPIGVDVRGNAAAEAVAVTQAAEPPRLAQPSTTRVHAASESGA